MPFTLSDSTSSTQRLAFSNSGGAELGAATPGSSLTIAGRQLLSGPTLAPNSVPSQGLNRITGVVTLTSRTTSTVAVGPCAGLGTISGAKIIFFDASGFTAALMSSSTGVTRTCSYSVF